MMTEAGGSDADDEEVETTPPMAMVPLDFRVPTTFMCFDACACTLSRVTGRRGKAIKRGGIALHCFPIRSHAFPRRDARQIVVAGRVVKHELKTFLK